MESIYGTLREHTVGKTYRGLTKQSGELFPLQPFAVLRTATYAEWLAFAEAEGIRPSAAMLAAAQRAEARFYAISTD
jgi:hypothetical protein